MKTFLIAYIIFINIVGFCLMGLDKRRAVQRRWRIPERTLFATALLFGSIGVLTGIYVFRHKTRHLTFTIGIPAILVVQLLLVAFLVSWNEQRLASPSTAVEHELSLIRELDGDTIEAFVSYDNLTNSHLFSDSAESDAVNAVRLFFKNFHYSIQEEEVDQRTATVKVNITNSDMHALAQDLCCSILRQTSSLYPDRDAAESVNYYRLLHDTLLANRYDTTVTTATFHLERDESGWVILVDDALKDELVSGFISYMNDPYILPASKVLSIQLDAFCELDGSQWKDYLRIEDVFATYNTDYYAQIDDEYTAQIAACFDYEILKCRENGNTATATVRITSLDMPEILSRYKKYLLEYAATTKSIRDNDVQVSNETSRLLLAALQENQSANSTDLDLTFRNNGEAWEIYFDHSFTNAVMGDIDTAIETFNTISTDPSAQEG